MEPVRERLQAGTEDAPVLDRPAPLRRLHDSGAGYKHSDLFTYSADSFSKCHVWYRMDGWTGAEHHAPSQSRSVET